MTDHLNYFPSTLGVSISQVFRSLSTSAGFSLQGSSRSLFLLATLFQRALLPATRLPQNQQIRVGSREEFSTFLETANFTQIYGPRKKTIVFFHFTEKLRITREFEVHKKILKTEIILVAEKEIQSKSIFQFVLESVFFLRIPKLFSLDVCRSSRARISSPLPSIPQKKFFFGRRRIA